MASGTVSFSLNTWHTLSLKLANGTVEALIDKTSVASIQDTTYTHGQIALLVSKWVNAQFDNISVTAV